MKKAIYALSADPITKGHLNIIKRASKMFEHLIVAIGNNASKKYMFSPEERISIAKEAINELKIKNVSVEVFEGTLADFAFINNANVIVRGLRNINDFQQEQDLANINKSLNNQIETCFILTENEHSYISSSASKEIIKNNYFGDKYLPLSSKSSLQSKINKQYFLGITGLMGSGKSHIAEKLSAYSKSMELEIHNLDLDVLCHAVYDEKNKDFEKQRQLIVEEFGTLDRKTISNAVFSKKEKLEKINDIFAPVIEYQVRKHSMNKEGIILINGATIISMGLLSTMCNNRIIFVDTKEEVRHKRCEEGRGVSSEIVQKRDGIMLNMEEQKKIALNEIEKSQFGEIIIFENNDRKPNIVKLYEKLINLF